MGDVERKTINASTGDDRRESIEESRPRRKRREWRV